METYRGLLKFYFFILISLTAIFFYWNSYNSTIFNELKIGNRWEKALNSDKPVLAYFYVDYCKNCKIFNPVILNTVSEYKNNLTFIPVKGDSPENYIFTSKLKVRSFPAVYILDPKSKSISKIDASVQKTCFQQTLQNYLENLNKKRK